MNDEYGTIFDADHFAVHDGPGIRTVVYFKGCPLRCVWCHSPESHIKALQLLRIAERCRHCEVCLGEKCVNGAAAVSGKNVRASEVLDEVIQDKVFFDSSGGGVTLSGGEVLFQPEFAESLLERLHNAGIHTIVETSGMGQWRTLQNISKYTDVFYYDIKTLNSEKHKAYTGAGNEVILENLQKLAEYRQSAGITIRVPLIPGYNDSPGETEELYRFAGKLNVKNIHLLRYNTSAPAKYQWLRAPYRLGELQRQSDGYIGELLKIAPEEMEITVL